MADPQLADALKRGGIKSSFSMSNGDCFTVCRTSDGRVAIWQSRQEDNPGRPIVFGTQAEWEAFEAGIKAGEFPYEKLPVAMEKENVPAGKNS